MIHELYIRNCALVEEIRVDFAKKLNILTGETGSGKSIILEAINLCLGGKYDRSYLRRGAEEGEVETVVFSDSEVFLKALKEKDIVVDDENMVVISRKLYNDGKTITKINGKNVKVSDLKYLMSKIVDMHGQHQNQALYNRDKHLEFLDLFGKEKIKKEYIVYKECYKEYNDIKRKILKLNDNKSNMELQREKDLLSFQINEIEAAALDADEYEDLKKRKEILENGEKIFSSLSESYQLLHAGQFNAEDQIGKTSNLLSSISKYDKDIEKIEEAVNNLLYEFQEIATTVRVYLDSVDFDPSTLNEIQERLDVINNLRRKYGDSIDEIFKYYEKIKERLDDIENREEKNAILERELNAKEEELSLCAESLSRVRKELAKKLEEDLLKELCTLNMKNTEFKVNFKKIEYNDKGNDDVEFFVSFNLGEDLNPLYKVASGGEMSRFMLAFKSILSDVDKIETLIFDEIDTGISGRAAQTVGEKLSAISKEKQVICITHLPQIASFADEHFYIEKNVENERTYTSIEKLDKTSKKNEIARLISGTIITEKTVEHAGEILEIADEIKK